MAVLAKTKGMFGGPPQYVQGDDLRARIEAFLTGGGLAGARGPNVGPVDPLSGRGFMPPPIDAPPALGNTPPFAGEDGAVGARRGVTTSDPPYGEDGPVPDGYGGMIGAGNPARKRRGFRDVASGIGEFLVRFNALNGNPAAMQMLQMRQTSQDNQDRFKLEHIQQQRLQDEADWRREYQSRPQFRTVNGQVVQLDPMGGADPEVIYQAPEDFEVYANAMGFEPGTPEYLEAQQDFVLRGSGPTALENRTAYENARQGNRVALEGVRQGNRQALENTRQGNRAAIVDQRARIDRMRDSWFGSPARGQGGRRTGGRSNPNGRQWVRDNQGNRIEAEVRNGVWVNVATGRPL